MTAFEAGATIRAASIDYIKINIYQYLTSESAAASAAPRAAIFPLCE
jgi:hypothetical protein